MATGAPDAALTADQAARLAATTADLTWITHAWRDHYRLHFPGTRRRTTPRPLTRNALSAADELARTEKAEQDPDGILGASPAPMDVGVLDDLARILADAIEVAARISWNAGAHPPREPRTAYDFGALDRHLTHIAEHLPAATTTDPEALDIAQTFATQTRRTLERTMVGTVDGQVLTAVCAWCEGATSEAPTGGQRTLAVRLVAGEPLIVCEGGLCEPSSEDCGTWLFGKPAWREAEWEWLAKRLISEHEAVA